MELYKILDSTNSKNDAESLYERNEGWNGGFFPVGKNNCWHGGIHIPTIGRNVLTLLSGKLAAYAIYENHGTVSLPERISKEQYKKNKYMQVWLNGKKENEENCYEDAKENNILYYKLKEGYKDAKKTVSKGFMLVKHTLAMPSSQKETKKIDFFLLYMHLAPTCELGLVNEFTHVKNVDKFFTLPFYYKWIFKLSSVGDSLPEKCKYKIKTADNTPALLLEGMLYEISEPKYFYANFQVQDSSLEVKIQNDPKNQEMKEFKLYTENLDLGNLIDKTINIISDKNAKNIYVYKNPAANYDEMLKSIYGEIGGDVNVTREEGIVSWQKADNNNIIKIEVPKRTKIKTIGFTKALSQGVKKAENEIYLTKIYELKDVREFVDFKIVNLSEYLMIEYSHNTYNYTEFDVKIVGNFVWLAKRKGSFVSQTITPEGKYAIIAWVTKHGYFEPEPESTNFFAPSLELWKYWAQQTRYLFSTEDGKIIPVNFITKNYDNYNGVEILPPVKAYKIQYNKYYVAPKGASLELLKTQDGFPKIEGIQLIKAESFLDSNAIFYANAENFKMKKGPIGRLKLTNSNREIIDKPGYLLTESFKARTITRDILAANTEFAVEKVQNFLKNNDTNEIRIKKEGCIARKPEPNIPLELFEVKSKLIKEYEGKLNEIQTPDEKEQEHIPAQTIIGCGGNVKDTNDFIHFGMFTKNELPDEVCIPHYIIDSDFYTYEAVIENGKEVYLPKGTVLSLKEPADKKTEKKPYDNKYIKVGIKKIPLNIHIDDLKINQDDRICEVNEKFTKEILVGNKDGIIDTNNEKNTKDKVKHLQEKLLGRGKELCRRKYNYTEIKDERDFLQVEIEIESIAELPEWYFWIQIAKVNTSEVIALEGHTNCIYKDGEIALSDSFKLKFWDKCPGTYKYTKKEFNVTKQYVLLEKDVTDGYGFTDDITEKNASYKHLAASKIDIEDIKNIAVKATKTIKKDDSNISKEEDIVKKTVDWKDFFKLYKDANKDIICDVIEDILKDACEGENEKISYNEIMKIYSEREKYWKIIQFFRRVACRFPFEFDKELYGDNYKKTMRRELKINIDDISYGQVTELMEQLDIWDKINKVKGLYVDGLNDDKTLLHMNPVHGIEVFDSLGLLEFNPYYGKEDIKIKNNDNFHLQDRNQIVRDNPGFAPVASGRTNYIYKEVYYSNCTSLFNIEREWTDDKKFIHKDIHTGVDLAPGEEGKSVISLIYGEVWACTYQGSIKKRDFSISGYGKVMIIKGNDRKLYLLAHLDKYIKKVSDIVCPGDEVAICGTTGNSTNEHLHVEVRLCEETDTKKEKVLADDGNQEYKDNKSIGLTWSDKYKNSKGPPRVNPFNHKEIYLGEWL